jgi:hypothetical protein
MILTQKLPLKCTKQYPLVPFRPTRETQKFYFAGDTAYSKADCIDFEKIRGETLHDRNSLAEMLAILAEEPENEEHLEVLAHFREVFDAEYLKVSARNLSPEGIAAIKSMVAKLDLV